MSQGRKWSDDELIILCSVVRQCKDLTWTKRADIFNNRMREHFPSHQGRTVPSIKGCVETIKFKDAMENYVRQQKEASENVTSCQPLKKSKRAEKFSSSTSDENDGKSVSATPATPIHLDESSDEVQSAEGVEDQDEVASVASDEPIELDKSRTPANKKPSVGKKRRVKFQSDTDSDHSPSKKTKNISNGRSENFLEAELILCGFIIDMFKVRKTDAQRQLFEYFMREIADIPGYRCDLNTFSAMETELKKMGYRSVSELYNNSKKLKMPKAIDSIKELMVLNGVTDQLRKRSKQTVLRIVSTLTAKKDDIAGKKPAIEACPTEKNEEEKDEEEKDEAIPVRREDTAEFREIFGYSESESEQELDAGDDISEQPIEKYRSYSLLGSNEDAVYHTLIDIYFALILIRDGKDYAFPYTIHQFRPHQDNALCPGGCTLQKEPSASEATCIHKLWIDTGDFIPDSNQRINIRRFSETLILKHFQQTKNRIEAVQLRPAKPAKSAKPAMGFQYELLGTTPRLCVIKIISAQDPSLCQYHLDIAAEIGTVSLTTRKTRTLGVKIIGEFGTLIVVEEGWYANLVEKFEFIWTPSINISKEVAINRGLIWKDWGQLPLLRMICCEKISHEISDGERQEAIHNMALIEPEDSAEDTALHEAAALSISKGIVLMPSRRNYDKCKLMKCVAVAMLSGSTKRKALVISSNSEELSKIGRQISKEVIQRYDSVIESDKPKSKTILRLGYEEMSADSAVESIRLQCLAKLHKQSVDGFDDLSYEEQTMILLDFNKKMVHEAFMILATPAELYSIVDTFNNFTHLIVLDAELIRLEEVLSVMESNTVGVTVIGQPRESVKHSKQITNPERSVYEFLVHYNAEQQQKSKIITSTKMQTQVTQYITGTNDSPESNPIDSIDSSDAVLANTKFQLGSMVHLIADHRIIFISYSLKSMRPNDTSVPDFIKKHQNSLCNPIEVNIINMLLDDIRAHVNPTTQLTVNVAAAYEEQLDQLKKVIIKQGDNDGLKIKLVNDEMTPAMVSMVSLTKINDEIDDQNTSRLNLIPIIEYTDQYLFIIMCNSDSPAQDGITQLLEDATKRFGKTFKINIHINEMTLPYFSQLGDN